MPEVTSYICGGNARQSILSRNGSLKKNKKITTYSLEFTPAQFLLHHQVSKDIPYHKSLAMMLINAAKMCIPKPWGTSKAPSVADWYKRINKIAGIEELISISQNSPHKFSSSWACWIHFWSSKDYSQMMGTHSSNQT